MSVPNLETAAFHQTATRNKAAVRKHLQFWEQMDIPAFLTLFAEDARQVSPFVSGLFREQVVGKDELRAYWENVPNQFSSIKLSVEGIHAMEDPSRVFAHYRGEMTLRDGSGVYENDYYSLFRFNEHGKIVEHVKLFDPIATARSFGLIGQIR